MISIDQGIMHVLHPAPHTYTTPPENVDLVLGAEDSVDARPPLRLAAFAHDVLHEVAHGQLPVQQALIHQALSQTEVKQAELLGGSGGSITAEEICVPWYFGVKQEAASSRECGAECRWR